MSEEPIVICRLVRERKPLFAPGDMVVLKDDPQKREATVLQCVTEGYFAGTTRVQWQDTGAPGIAPTEHLLPLSEWKALEERQRG